MLKRWRPAAAGLLRDVNGIVGGGGAPPASWATTRTERGLCHPRGRQGPSSLLKRPAATARTGIACTCLGHGLRIAGYPVTVDLVLLLCLLILRLA